MSDSVSRALCSVCFDSCRKLCHPETPQAPTIHAVLLAVQRERSSPGAEELGGAKNGRPGVTLIQAPLQQPRSCPGPAAATSEGLRQCLGHCIWSPITSHPFQRLNLNVSCPPPPVLQVLVLFCSPQYDANRFSLLSPGSVFLFLLPLLPSVLHPAMRGAKN